MTQSTLRPLPDEFYENAELRGKVPPIKSGLPIVAFLFGSVFVVITILNVFANMLF